MSSYVLNYAISNVLNKGYVVAFLSTSYVVLFAHQIYHCTDDIFLREDSHPSFLEERRAKFYSTESDDTKEGKTAIFHSCLRKLEVRINL